MKSIRNLTLATLISIAGAAHAAPAMTANPGFGYMGFQTDNSGAMGMGGGRADIYVDIFPFAEDAMSGMPLDGYVVANVPGLGGMFIFTADAGWQPWDQQTLTPAVRMADCTAATPCTRAQFAILRGMDVNDPALQAMLNGATIYLGYGRAGEGVAMDRVRQFTASDMITPGMHVSIAPALCSAGMPRSRFCL